MNKFTLKNYPSNILIIPVCFIIAFNLLVKYGWSYFLSNTLPGIFAANTHNNYELFYSCNVYQYRE